MRFDLFVCPKCREKLVQKGGSLFCKNKHCFDIAKEGYVNLMLANEKHSLNPGDNDDMVVSRSEFLKKRYYYNMAKEVANVVSRYKKQANILDAGCGTGYYTKVISDECNNESIYGVDIAKSAVKIASKYVRNADFAVSSVFNTPFDSGIFDVIISIFSPLAFEEFARILKDDGIVVCVYPGESHLVELKRAIYGEETILNDKAITSDIFASVEKRNVAGLMNLSKEDIQNLVRMTPYFYTTPKEKLDNLNCVESLDVQYDFIIEVLKKN